MAGVVLLMLAGPVACAQPGTGAGAAPAATPTATSATLHASGGVRRPDIRPASGGPRLPGAPRRPGIAVCAQPPGPIAKPDPSRPRGVRPGRAEPPRPAAPGETVPPRAAATGAAVPPRGADPDRAAQSPPSDALERRRRTLASQHSPIPRRGDVAPPAAAGAEQCILDLRQQFALRSAGSGRAPDEAGITAALTGAGLTGPVVGPGPSFAASTGEACVLGTFDAGTPAFTIAALPADRTCRP